MKKFLVGIICTVVVVGVFFAGFFVGSYTNEDVATLKFVLNNYKKYYLNEDEHYLDIMIDSLLKDDKYSEYYTKEEYDLIKKSSEGKQYGVGFSTNSQMQITRVVGNSPAERAGVKVGGKILAIKKVDGERFVNLDGESALFDFLATVGDGEEIVLKVLYQTEEDFTIEKREYQETFVYYVDEESGYKFSDESGKMKFVSYSDEISDLLDEKTAYLKYTGFNGLSNDLTGSAKQFETALDKFKNDERQKLIVDLRGNGGGFMDIMCKISAHLVGSSDSNPLVSKAVYKDGKIDRFTTKNVKYNDYDFERIIFLADDGTASASEALIGACLDYDVRDVVRVVLSKNGDGSYRTYGKGIMQTTIESVKGNAIKLTTAQIYWPVSNVTIHEVGINKNIEKYRDKIIEAPYIENCDYELIASLSL